MALMVHRAARADQLVEGLAAVLSSLAEGPHCDLDVFATELVVVPARGVERWLSQRLSHRLGSVDGDGVCAGVNFVSPSSFGRLVGAAEGGPWSVGELTWTLLAVIDESLDEHWCFTLATHLGHFDTGDDADLKWGRRFATAQRLARLFVSYVAQRPAMLLAWEAGAEVDGLGSALPEDLAWQPELWRRARGVSAALGPVQAHARLCEHMASGELGELDLALPARINLFGHTRISEADLQLLQATATRRAVHLWLPHPSAALWRTLAELPDQRTRYRGSHTSEGRAAGAASAASDLVAIHPLLAAWGRDSRELQLRLGEDIEDAEDAEEEAPVDATVDAMGPTRTSLLAQLQGDIGANRLPTTWSGAADHSISVHNCHGPSRQVEVLREVLVGLLQDDPTLQPRDIVVMCPDIEAYAPLIEAAFGLGDVLDVTHPGQRLRVRLADRALVQTNPLMGVVGSLLNLAAGRAEASRILDFLALAPVRRRFAFTDEDLEKIADWVEETGVRWAFDQRHRLDYGLEDYPQNTWKFGLDRLLVGVALSEESQRWLGQTLPLDDVGSSDVELVGRLTESVRRLSDITDALEGRHPLVHWLETLGGAVESLALNERGEDWQLAQVRRELAGLLAGAEASGQTDAELMLKDVRALVADRVAGRPTRANFRTGSLTVCTMTPMRSVPHRVVCLLGLDDGVFPRSLRAHGDDVLARTPAIGDRDRRSEDRQLLLDAVLAATDRLIITYSGRNEISGQMRPPTVVLRELIDVVSAMAPEATVTHQEPLQAFNADLLSAQRPRSFDVAMARAARAAQGVRVVEQPLGEVLLPAQPRRDLELEDLISFFGDPAKAFLRHRLEVNVDSEDSAGSARTDELPVDLDGLAQWKVGDRMLQELFEGADPKNVLDREWRRGALPPGKLGWAMAQQILQQAAPVAAMAQTVSQGLPASTQDIALDLGGRLVTGTVTDLFDTRVVKKSYSRMGPKAQLEAWLSLLALAADAPGRTWSAGALGRGSRTPVERVAFVRPENPLELLQDLVAIYDAGMRGPLPLPLKTSFAWARGRAESVSRANAWAMQAWKSDRFAGEDAKPAQVALWGPHMPWKELLALAPQPGEDPRSEGTRLGALALTVWGPMITHSRAEKSS